MLKQLSLVLVICASASFASAGFPDIAVGNCIKGPVISTFSVPLYTGVWYEQQRQNVFFEDTFKCNKATYGINPNQSVSVANHAIDINTGKSFDSIGHAVQSDPNAPNRLIVYFPDNPKGGDYQVWSTDYTSYSVVYSCKQIFPLIKLEYAWILTRKVNGITDDLLNELKQFVSDNGLPPNKFIDSNYDGCNL